MALLRRGVSFVGSYVRPVVSGLPVEIFGDVGQRFRGIAYPRHEASQVQVAPRSVEERLAQRPGNVAAELDLRRGLDPHFRPAQEVVGHHQALVIVDQADQAPEPASRIMNAIVHDAAIAGVIGKDAVFRAPHHEVIAHDAPRGMDGDIGRAVGVAQANARVAIDDHIALDDAILGIVPEEDRTPALAGTPLDAHEHVVGDHPAPGEHHVDAADVVAIEGIRPVAGIVGELLGPIVVEQAVLHAAIGGAKLLAALGGHGRPFDAPLPDVVDHAVVDAHAVGTKIGVDLQSVGPDVLDGQVRNRYPFGLADAYQLDVPASSAIQHHPLPPARSAAERHPVGMQLEIPRHEVVAIGKQDRAAGRHLLGSGKQLLYRAYADHGTLRRRQGRRLRHPGEGGRLGDRRCVHRPAGQVRRGSHRTPGRHTSKAVPQKDCTHRSSPADPY